MKRRPLVCAWVAGSLLAANHAHAEGGGGRMEDNIDVFWAPYKKSLRLPITAPVQRRDRYNYPGGFEEWAKVLNKGARFQFYE